MFSKVDGAIARIASETAIARDVGVTLAERQSTHGDFQKTSAIAQELKRVLRGLTGTSTNWQRLDDDQQEAADAIAMKLARVLSGNPNNADSWHDIGGYARLVEQRLLRDSLQMVNVRGGNG